MIALEERFKRSLPVRFTQDELRGKADELADKVARRESLEEEKKRVGADYKARIDATTSDINLLARHITERCEYQQVECQAYLDFPDHGKKTIFRVDTGEEVGVETMQPADRQAAFQWEQAHANANPLATPTAETTEAAPVEAAPVEQTDTPVVEQPAETPAEPQEPAQDEASEVAGDEPVAEAKPTLLDELGGE